MKKTLAALIFATCGTAAHAQDIPYDHPVLAVISNSYLNQYVLPYAKSESYQDKWPTNLTSDLILNSSFGESLLEHGASIARVTCIKRKGGKTTVAEQSEIELPKMTDITTVMGEVIMTFDCP